MYASRLLVAAVAHLRVFETLHDGPHTLESLRGALNLADRPSQVLFPSLRAMGLMDVDAAGIVRVTPLGGFLTQREPAHLINYVGLEADDPGVVAMAQLLRHDGSDSGAPVAFVKDDTAPSPMDDPGPARAFTHALAGRAKLLAPLVARSMPGGRHLLDVACGTGLFAYEWLRLNAHARATLLDRPAVLDVAREMLERFAGQNAAAATVSARVLFLPGDMLHDALPDADVVLAASVFHDWPETVCASLMRRLAGALPVGGTLLVHDSFLSDAMDGPLAASNYSAQLFWHTKGRLYSRGEFSRWMVAAGLRAAPGLVPTGLDYALMSAMKL